ncbi:hypothetical protein ACWCSD_34505 [Nonomuraea sp. NPDC001684]
MTDVTLPMTVAKARTVLADATQYEAPDDPTSVMVSSFYGSLGWRFTGRAEIGYFKQLTDPHRPEQTVGHLTRNPDDGPRVAALIAPYHETISVYELDKAADTHQLAKLLEHLALVDPDMLLVVPDHDYNDKARFVPLGTHMGFEYYAPESDFSPGAWGYEPGEGPGVFVLWPASSFTPPPPEPPAPAPAAPTPPAPTDWFARLAQTETWTDEYGRPHRITSMTPLQAYSALSWLDIHARRISDDVIGYLLGNSAAAFPDSRTRAPLLESAVAVADPRGWIATTPLALALALQAG